MIGASSGVVILVGIIRTKFMAVLLGPAGFGLMGVFNSIVDLATAIASVGVAGSGVRQIAAAAGTEDVSRIATTVRALRRLSLVLGVLGAVAMILFRDVISTVTFGTNEYAWAVAGLGAAVAFRVVAAGQGALVQGMRRIADVAMIGLVGAVLGTITGVALVWSLGERGIVPAVGAMAAATLAASWWYSRRIQLPAAGIDKSVAEAEVVSLLKLGLAFMASGFLMMGSAYAVRAMVLQWDGPDAAGYYQAAWTIGGMYVGIILQAMGADFYPRLTGAANDHALMNRLVNEQTQVGLLLAAPGVVATLCFAPLAILLLYSSEFGGAIDVLRWICLGMALRVISWPMGYTVLAKGEQTLFFAVELAWTVVNVGLAAILIPRYGADGAGIAFFVSYAFHLAMVYAVSRWLTGFSWTPGNWKAAAYFIVVVALVFIGLRWITGWIAYVIGALVVIGVTTYSVRQLVGLVNENQMPDRLRGVLRWMNSIRTDDGERGR